MSGVWMPNLLVLNVSGGPLGAPALRALLQGDRGQLKGVQLTGNLRDTAVFEQSVARCEHQQLWHLQTQAAQPISDLW